MGDYVKKSLKELKYDESKKRVRFELRILLDRLADLALAEMTADFNAEVNAGGLSAFSIDQGDTQRYLRQATSIELGEVAGA